MPSLDTLRRVSTTLNLAVIEAGGPGNWEELSEADKVSLLLNNEPDLLVPVPVRRGEGDGPGNTPVVIKGTGWQINLFSSRRWTWSITGEV